MTNSPDLSRWASLLSTEKLEDIILNGSCAAYPPAKVRAARNELEFRYGEEI